MSLKLFFDTNFLDVPLLIRSASVLNPSNSDRFFGQMQLSLRIDNC